MEEGVFLTLNSDNYPEHKISPKFSLFENLGEAGGVKGGEGGIRTHGDPKATTVFETAPFGRSGTSPQERQL
jgi:hypothetical protein